MERYGKLSLFIGKRGGPVLSDSSAREVSEERAVLRHQHQQLQNCQGQSEGRALPRGPESSSVQVPE